MSQLELLISALDHASIVVFTDARGVITHVNRNFCEISGYSENELLGRTHQIVNSGVHDSEFFAEMWQTLRAGKIWRGEICNRAKNGALYWVDTTIVPFSEVGPYQSKYVAIRNDITEKKQFQKELEEERLRAIFSEKMASLGELTAGIAHELGNPIAAIQGRAEMLRMAAQGETGLLAEQAFRTSETILKLTDRLGGVLRSMRAFARDGTHDPMMKVSLKSIFNNTIELGSEKYRKRGISVQIMPYQSELHVMCRDTQIIQILINLINNACDAVQNLPERWIKCEVLEKSDHIILSVTDSGTGIPEAVRKKLFQPFFTTKEVGRGTGLGLNISRKLAEHNGGSLTVDESCPNTRFELRLVRG